MTDGAKFIGCAKFLRLGKVFSFAHPALFAAFGPCSVISSVFVELETLLPRLDIPGMTTKAPADYIASSFRTRLVRHSFPDTSYE